MNTNYVVHIICSSNIEIQKREENKCCLADVIQYICTEHKNSSEGHITHTKTCFVSYKCIRISLYALAASSNCYYESVTVIDIYVDTIHSYSIVMNTCILCERNKHTRNRKMFRDGGTELELACIRTYRSTCIYVAVSTHSIHNRIINKSSEIIRCLYKYHWRRCAIVRIFPIYYEKLIQHFPSNVCIYLCALSRCT